MRFDIDFGLSLEMSVILPLAIATIVIIVVYRSYPVARPEAS